MNPPAIPGILSFHCPPDQWREPSRMNEPAPEGVWNMVSMTLDTVRPGNGECRSIELAQGVL